MYIHFVRERKLILLAILKSLYMKILCHWLLGGSIAAFSACGSAAILTPSEGQYITSPFNFRVEKKGCGILRVFLDRNTGNEKEITGLFQYDKDNIWVASKADVPLGAHEIFASAFKEARENCYTSGETHSFLVMDKTCISGIVLKKWNDSDTPVAMEDASITVLKSGTQEKFASGTSEPNGHFCIEGIPLGVALDIKIHYPIAGGAFEAWVNNMEIPTATNRSCSAGTCFDAGRIDAKYYAY